MAKHNDKDRGWNRSAGELEYQDLLRQYADAPVPEDDVLPPGQESSCPPQPEQMEAEAPPPAPKEKQSRLLDKLFSGSAVSSKGKYYKKRSKTVPQETPPPVQGEPSSAQMAEASQDVKFSPEAPSLTMDVPSSAQTAEAPQEAKPDPEAPFPVPDGLSAAPEAEAAQQEDVLLEAAQPEGPATPSAEQKAKASHKAKTKSSRKMPPHTVEEPSSAQTAEASQRVKPSSKEPFPVPDKPSAPVEESPSPVLSNEEKAAAGELPPVFLESDGASLPGEAPEAEHGQEELRETPSPVKKPLAKKASSLARLWKSYKDRAMASRPEEATFLDWVYTECYFIGIQLMRDGTSYRRQGLTGWKWLSQKVPAFVRRQRSRVLRVWDNFSDATLAPFREISKKTALMGASMRRAKRDDPEHTLRRRFSVFFSYLWSLGRPLNRIANFVAPIIGVTILAATITYFSDITFGLRLTYPDENSFMGYIADENVFYEARNKVLERLIGEEYIEPENSGPGFSLVIVKEDNLLDPETLANKLISASGNDIENADGIYIEDKFLGAVKDGSEFLLYIDSVLDNYRSDEEHELVQFVKKITLRSGVYPVGSMKSLHDIKEYLDSDVPYEETHTVADGDTLEGIADSYSTTVEQLRLLNPGVDSRLEDDPSADVYPGEELLVSRSNLTLGIQVTRREEYTEDVPYGDTKVENDQLPSGYTEVISNGVPGEQLVTADVTYIDGEKVGENRVSVELTKEPVNRRLKVGTKPLLQYLPVGSDTSGSFLWPVDGGYMSAGLYGYYGHTGMDIAAPYGTVVRASRAGYITYATNVSIWPYGKRVDINHQDGFTSRYAHMSTVVVSSGTYVEQGQIIGYVGRTGNASGNHCHLEIRLNGIIMNPASYIGTYYPGR